jgi:hypothetical protein
LVTTLSPERLLARDVLDLDKGRGAFEGTLADEAREGDPDRWCSLTGCGQACWHIVWQWVWNLRLAFSVGCAQAPWREMEWAPPQPQTGVAVSQCAAGSWCRASVSEPAYGPLAWASVRGARRGAEACALQDDGTLRCPQGAALWRSEIRQETAFTPRLVLVARDAGGGVCPRRSTCRGRSASGTRGRRVSAVRRQRITEVVLHPRPVVAEAAIRWNDVAGL